MKKPNLNCPKRFTHPNQITYPTCFDHKIHNVPLHPNCRELQNQVPSETFMWRLVWGYVLRFSGMFKDSYTWLQITLENQMLGFPLNLFWWECEFFLKQVGTQILKLKGNCIFYKLPILNLFLYHLNNWDISFISLPAKIT